MTHSQGPSSSPLPTRWAVVRQKGFNYRALMSAAAVATILALLLAIYAYLRPPASPSLGWSSEAPHTTAARSNSSQASTASSSNPTESPVTRGVLQPGSCLAENKVVPCDMSHDSEVLPAATPCTTVGILHFLGGIQDLDTPGPWVTYHTIRDGDASGCVVTVATSITGGLTDALLGPAGDQLRRCWNSQQEREVTCAQAHTGEYVYLSDSDSNTDCTRRLEEYSNADTTRMSPYLDVRSVVLEGKMGCIAETRGDNLLQASIRRLGVKALPLR